jgi:hypothetical protein
MAEDLRRLYPKMLNMTKSKDLIDECRREVENCLYTSTSFFIWLRWRRCVKTIFIVAPLILGSFATWELVTQSSHPVVRVIASVAAFVAGLMPSIYAALKYDDDLEKLRLTAAEFKNLQDRFRQVAVFSSKKSFKEFEMDFQAAMERMEKVRCESLTPPEWCFKKAQKKVQSGDYHFDVDIEAENNTAHELPKSANSGDPA